MTSLGKDASRVRIGWTVLLTISFDLGVDIIDSLFRCNNIVGTY